MWLLSCRTKALVEFDNEDTKPPYAILSHTWVKNEEITYQDIQSGNPRQISGWEKVKACCKRAIEDGFDYCWVDTCCINKTSSAELSEAINSMFQWYADAEVCYAFLTDVDSMVDTDEFESSRWFSRGWTLQELLAPRKVIFFSREWKPIGTRETLKARISRTTKIHEDALTGDVSEIRKFSVAQRMSWASPRTTTRSEDVAYCVLGLFNVNMPLLYGEGKKAFIRLQEEIMKDSDDQSIFSWQRPAGSDLCGMLAPAPSNFRECFNIVPFRFWKVSEPYVMTNAGLRVTGHLEQPDHNPIKKHVLWLQCYDEDDPGTALGVILDEIAPGGDQFARSHRLLYFKKGRSGVVVKAGEVRTIYIRKDIILPERHHILEIGKQVSFEIFPESQTQLIIEDVRPKKLWDKTRNIIKAPDFGNSTTRFNNLSWHSAVLLKAQCPQGTLRFVLFVGYDGGRDRCWCDVDSELCETEGDLEVIRVNGTAKLKPGLEAKHISPRPGIDWTVRVKLHDSRRDVIPRKFSEGWNGDPVRVKIDVERRAKTTSWLPMREKPRTGSGL